MKSKVTARDIVLKILGKHVTEDLERQPNRPFVLSGPWQPGMEYGMFVGFQELHRRTGSIGVNLHGRDPRSLAGAVHESMHAINWMSGGEQDDEVRANQMAEEWIRRNVDDKLQPEMLKWIEHSRQHYAKREV